MENLAGGTNGTHYHAISSAELNEVYYDIAGKLKTEAGVNTTMNITFGTVTVNEELFDGNDVFEYVYQAGFNGIKWPMIITQ
jgi:hypothetical protein